MKHVRWLILVFFNFKWQFFLHFQISSCIAHKNGISVDLKVHFWPKKKPKHSYYQTFKSNSRHIHKKWLLKSKNFTYLSRPRLERQNVFSKITHQPLCSYSLAVKTLFLTHYLSNLNPKRENFSSQIDRFKANCY